MHAVRLLVLAAFVALQAGCVEEPIASPDRSAAFEEGTAPVRLTDENFATEVLQSDQPVLVDAWAKWCQPCVELKPTLRRIAADFSGNIKVGELDVDANPFVAAKYEIERYPTLIIFVAGQEAERIVGVQTHKELTALLRRFAGPSTAPSSAP